MLSGDKRPDKAMRWQPDRYPGLILISAFKHRCALMTQHIARQMDIHNNISMSSADAEKWVARQSYKCFFVCLLKQDHVTCTTHLQRD